LFGGILGTFEKPGIRSNGWFMLMFVRNQ
jgi:hypothetical protein